jgi:EAL domain-containing protein (putative c-di-GMP-specific phosphodiesterase class I)
MKIGLIDVDGHNFPNLALMKISAYHKAKGDDVEWVFPLDSYDIVYQSKVFDDTYSKDIDYYPMADKIIKGGTGYGLNNVLPDEIEHIYPDYSLYPELTKETAYGFLTRGCPRACDFCIVADKEGRRSYKVADLSEFWNGQKYIKLLDPNLLSFLDVQIVRHHIMPSRIFFSITEEALSYDIMGCLGTISALNHNGYGIHLSGFNNGYLRHDFVEDNNISSVSINGRNTKRMLISEYDRHMLSKYITKCLAINKFKIICDGIDNIVTLQTLKGCNITLMEGSLLPCNLTPLEVINILIKHQPVISK